VEEAITNAKEALELWFEPTEIPVSESATLVEVTIWTGLSYFAVQRITKFEFCPRRSA
jgi:hypothetical protein